MGYKGPKTLRGMERKLATGDGRKSTPVEKTLKKMDTAVEGYLKEADKATRELISGKKKKKRK